MIIFEIRCTKNDVQCTMLKYDFCKERKVFAKRNSKLKISS